MQARDRPEEPLTAGPPAAGSKAVPHSLPAEPGVALTVVPWVDPVLDRHGVDPRSEYVEGFWLGVLGPSATLFLRQLARGLERAPGGFLLDLELAARSLGLSPRGGPNAPFSRTLSRCVRFGMVRHQGHRRLEARRRIGPVPQRHLTRLPLPLQEAHQAVVASWSQARCPHEAGREVAAERSNSKRVRAPKPVPPLVR